VITNAGFVQVAKLLKITSLRTLSVVAGGFGCNSAYRWGSSRTRPPDSRGAPSASLSLSS